MAIHNDKPDHACIGPGCTFCLAARELGVSRPGDVPDPVCDLCHQPASTHPTPTCPWQLGVQAPETRTRTRYQLTIEAAEVTEMWNPETESWEYAGGQELDSWVCDYDTASSYTVLADFLKAKEAVLG